MLICFGRACRRGRTSGRVRMVVGGFCTRRSDGKDEDGIPRVGVRG